MFAYKSVPRLRLACIAQPHPLLPEKRKPCPPEKETLILLRSCGLPCLREGNTLVHDPPSESEVDGEKPGWESSRSFVLYFPTYRQHHTRGPLAGLVLEYIFLGSFSAVSPRNVCNSSIIWNLKLCNSWNLKWEKACAHLLELEKSYKMWIYLKIRLRYSREWDLHSTANE